MLRKAFMSYIQWVSIYIKNLKKSFIDENVYKTQYMMTKQV